MHPGQKILVSGLFSIGYFPIANFFKDISPSDKCLPEFLPIVDFYPSCFAHQEKSLPGFIPITILPIIWWIFTHQNFAHQRIAHHTGKNQKFTKKIKISAIFQLFPCTKSIQRRGMSVQPDLWFIDNLTQCTFVKLSVFLKFPNQDFWNHFSEFQKNSSL